MTKKNTCGIIMPISAIDGCDESHWGEVVSILTDAIDEAGFEANIVSNADDVGIIQKRIIQNLYDNPIVVCDVSGKNPNVMFELGMRLAFDKPTIIIKDDKTSYSFDTSSIEHLEYPRDLRFSQIVEFKQNLTDKISATYKKATNDSSYTTFLKHFGEFKVAKLDKKEVPGQEFILEELRNLKNVVLRNENNNRALNSRVHIARDRRFISLRGYDKSEINEIIDFIEAKDYIKSVSSKNLSSTQCHLYVEFEDDCEINITELRREIHSQWPPIRVSRD